MSSKPKYRVPSMAEVESVRATNGYTHVSTFSGCGGSCLGLEMAGFDTLWANEFIVEAQNTYRLNHPHTILEPKDIRQVKADEIMALLDGRELDLFEGSPPCASFSTCGKREAGWGNVKGYSDKKQRTDDLFWEFARLLGELRPRAFIAENVSGLVRGSAVGYFKDIFAMLSALGYRVEARLVNAQWLGVPQSRGRIIFIGVREDLGVRPAFPKPWQYRYSTLDAIPWLMDPSANPATPEELAECDISRQAIAAYWHEIQPGQTHEKRFNMGKPHPNKPCPTIVASAGKLGLASVVHPYELRKLTVLEVKRVCSFPDDFALTGSYSQRIERMGRSVPPLMMKALGETIRDEVLAACDSKTGMEGEGHE